MGVIAKIKQKVQFYAMRSGRLVLESGDVINEGDEILLMQQKLDDLKAKLDNVKGTVSLSGSFYRLAAEAKPTAAAGAKDGDDLTIVDTGEIYIYYKGTWYKQ